MGVKVAFWEGSQEVFEHASSWFVDSDCNLSVYQLDPNNDEVTIAEFAKGHWTSARQEPAPTPPELPEDQDENKGSTHEEDRK